jgi:hypothetical protein
MKLAWVLFQEQLLCMRRALIGEDSRLRDLWLRWRGR